MSDRAPSTARVLIADDHALFRDCLGSLLAARGWRVVAEAGDGAEAVERAEALRPDLVLMDLRMPELDGVEATRRLAPLEDVKVVVLTASHEDADLFAALRAGADGYLLKDLEADAVFRYLEGVLRGEPALTPELARKVLHSFATPAPRASTPPRADLGPEPLTARETEILELLVAGHTSTRALCRELGVTANTVKFHVRNILEKLHLDDRAQVVAYALRHQLVAPP